MKRPLLVALVGPTASGKTDLSLRLAENIDITVISADSRQVFRELDIGTAKPSKEQRSRVPHRFIDIIGPEQEYSSGQFGEDALSEVRKVFDEGRLPLVVGGSGLYVRALIEGLTPLPGKDQEIRRVLEERLEEDGEQDLRQELKAVDPATSRAIEPGKTRRLIRALEVFYMTGRPLSDHHALAAAERPFRTLVLGLSVPRHELYERINTRAVRMLEDGIVAETEHILGMGVPRTAQALNTVGYKEVMSYLDGEITKEKMTERIQQSTRRFAKRQSTWFRGEKNIRWLDASQARPADALIGEIMEMLKAENQT